jgi:hypothetical protein
MSDVVVANFSDPRNAYGDASHFVATVDWGDGSAPSSGVVTQLSYVRYTVGGSHTYAADGTYTATVSIADAGGITLTTTSTIVVASALGKGTTTCTGFFGGTGKNVKVPAGATCTLRAGTHVKHDVKVQPGGTLIAADVAIGHDLEVDDAAGVQVDGGSVRHNLSVKGVTGTPAGGNYVRNVTVGHDLEVKDSSAAIVVSGNTVRHNLKVEDNRPGGATVSANSAGHTASCKGNVPQAGSGNTAKKKNTCPA